MDDLKRIDLRIASKTSQGLDPEAFMGIMQRWIQRNALPGVLIDVADYGHVHQGHGTVLIAHEFNLSIDYAGGQPSLLLRLKRPAEATLAARIEAGLRLAFKACRLLEQDPALGGKLSFDPSSFTFTANDRLLAPNDDATFAALKAEVEAAAKEVYGGAVSVKRLPADPRERLAMRIVSGKPVALAGLAGA